VFAYGYILCVFTILCTSDALSTCIFTSTQNPSCIYISGRDEQDLIETCRQDDRVYVNIEYGTHTHTHSARMYSVRIYSRYVYIITMELSRAIRFVFSVPMTTTHAVKGLCIDRRHIVDIIIYIQWSPLLILCCIINNISNSNPAK